ncbi:hypothetical protein [Nannocystis sp.]|uniref:hypothetical protein n=1 Tax=Nannocystis sp. TaxID=1962667 RepID=UPI00242224C3|nr:hypothetical protein [Nannocystis sp.]MBK7824778.1 hypothetical protein [Nannocystis sp.]MBK9752968.1 hypothetical protein [Nannocystis sp.]
MSPKTASHHGSAQPRYLSFQTAALAALLACGPTPTTPSPTPTTPSQTTAPTTAPRPDDDDARRLAELPHRVVFADRITYSYVLLLPGEPRPAPTRPELDAAVRAAFASNLDDEEVSLLLGLIARPEREFGVPAAPADPEQDAPDLLGLAIEAHPRTPTTGPSLIEDKVLADPDLTRDLTPDERASLTTRRGLLVLRAQYRNQHGVRGLRLLQTLVRVVAAQQGALIHDPDTLETIGPAGFAARRLQTSLGNVADQIPVVPFPDPRYPGRFRLASRGMRRFGSVDLELGGLPGDLSILQQATYFMHGLAFEMIELGEFDSAGFAVELPPIVTVHFSDCTAAYSGRPGSLPRCAGCPESAEIHLVERAAEPQDAISHVVARIVAPRSRSDRPEYDHLVWAQEALDRVLGRPPSM